jgi:phosphomannomutase
MLIRSASGLRGIVKDDFSSAMIDQYIASFISNQNITSCVIGRDGRPSGKEISQWVIDALTKYGVNVDNFDLVTTPTIQLMTEKDKYDGGIVITASHNPAEYNGLKFLQSDGTFLSPDQCKDLFNTADKKVNLKSSKLQGKLTVKDGSSHIAHVIDSVFESTASEFCPVNVNYCFNDNYKDIIQKNSGSLWDMKHKLGLKDSIYKDRTLHFNDLFRDITQYTYQEYEPVSMHGKFQTDFKNPVPRDTPLEDNIIRTIRKNSCETSALDILRFRRFKVVIDAVNGGASNLLPELCKELGCEVVTINCDGDGNFNRNPEPLSSNLKELESKVLEVGADIGFATDPDGDRLSIVSNSGKAIGEEFTLVLAAMSFDMHINAYIAKYIFLQSDPKLSPTTLVTNLSTLVTNLSTSQMIDYHRYASVYPVLRSKIGEAHVVKKMQSIGSIFGGEGNGGVIFKNAHLGRDSLVGAAFILKLLIHDWNKDASCIDNEAEPPSEIYFGKSNVLLKTIDEIIDNIPSYIFIKDKIKIDESINFDSLATVFGSNEISNEDYFENENGFKINREDGIKFTWPYKYKWIHIRKSNTEPIIRIFAEAKTENEVNDLIQTLKDYLK